MGNRSQNLQHEIEASVALSEEKPKARPRRSDGWRSDLDEELSRYFNGDYVGSAGLRSGFGAQLERQRDGVSFTGPGFVMPSPPRGVELHGNARLEVVRVEEALRRMSTGAAERVAEAAKKRVEETATKFDRPIRPGEVEKAVAEAVDEALMRVDHHLGVLQNYYRKAPSGAWTGLVGLGEFAMVAPLTEPIVRATKTWMREQLAVEIAHAASAAVVSAKEAEKRIEAWRAERTEADAAIAEYEANGEEWTGLVRTARRRALLRWRDDLDEQLAAATRAPERIDVAAIIRAKWTRPPTLDELRGRLREAHERTKPSKVATVEMRAAAKKLVDEALGAAKRDLGAARVAYAEARGAGRQSKKRESESPEERAKARIDAFDERLGLK